MQNSVSVSLYTCLSTVNAVYSSLKDILPYLVKIMVILDADILFFVDDCSYQKGMSLIDSERHTWFTEHILSEHMFNSCSEVQEYIGER